MKRINESLRTIGAIGFFSLLAMLLPLMTTTTNAQSIELTEAKFRRDNQDLDRFRLGDNDVIHLKMEKVRDLKDKVEIVLISSSNVTWWKGITIFKGIKRGRIADVWGGGEIADKMVRFNHIDTHDDEHGPDSMTLNVSDLGDYSYLTFEKAKAFGAHTPMYKFYLKKRNDKEFKYAGYRLTFTWERDG
jgi:hypothetical protein